MSTKIPHQVLIAMRDTANCLLEAIEADDNPNPEQQICYRKMAATGTHDSSQGGSFQVIVEICVDEKFFIPDGEIDIITDRMHDPDPYKIMPPKSSV